MKNYLEQAKNKLHDLEHDIATRTKGRFSGLVEKQRIARERLTALETTNKDRWDIVRQGFEDAWHELEAAWKTVRDDVKNPPTDETPSQRMHP